MQLVSIGIPTHNRSYSLTRAIESALAQDYPCLEVVISDNGSSDSTQELCESLCKQDDRIRYLRQHKNIGPTANFAAVLDAARGQYFMWLADDDSLSTEYVASCMRALQSTQGCVLACGQAVFTTRHGTTQLGEVLQLVHDSPERRVIQYLKQVRYNSVFYGLSPRSRLLEARLRNTLAFDWLLVVSMLAMGKAVTVPNAFLYRSGTGVSESSESLLAAVALPSWLAVLSRLDLSLAIGCLIFSEICWRSTVFSRYEASRRWKLGILSIWTIAAYQAVPARIARVRYKVRARSRLRRLWARSTKL